MSPADSSTSQLHSQDKGNPRVGLEAYKLSIIIGTKDRPESLSQTLETIAAQTRPPHEVVIIDDGHADHVALKDWSSCADIPLVYENKSHDPGLSKSRNLGVRLSSGNVVLFLDDDVLLEPEYIAELLRVYESDPEGEIGGVGGCIQREYRGGVSFFLRFFCLDSRHQGKVLPSGFASLFREGKDVSPVDWLSGCNMSYRKEVFNSLQFDENFSGNGWGDDKDFSFRVKQRFQLMGSPVAKLVHVEDRAGRRNPRHFGFVETNDAYFFFRKNMHQSLINRLAITWAMLGIILKNILRGHFRQVLGNLEGIIAIPSDPRGRRRN